MTLTMFRDEARRRLGEVCEATGEVLGTSWRGISEGLPIYIMGINPGGGCQKIGKNIECIPESTSAGQVADPLDGNTRSPWWSNYLDDYWKENRSFHPIQKHLFAFASALTPSIDLRRVCGTNLVFEASAHPSEIKNWQHKVESCWSVHELLMNIVRPKVLLTFGEPTREFVHSKCAPIHDYGQWPEVRSSRQRFCTTYRGLLVGRDVRVISVPHLGRFSLADKPTLMGWLQRLVADGMR
jgi:hypothetical protein